MYIFLVCHRCSFRFTVCFLFLLAIVRCDEITNAASYFYYCFMLLRNTFSLSHFLSFLCFSLRLAGRFSFSFILCSFERILWLPFSPFNPKVFLVLVIFITVLTCFLIRYFAFLHLICDLYILLIYYVNKTTIRQLPTSREAAPAFTESFAFLFLFFLMFY